jgi:hypothetical protein
MEWSIHLIVNVSRWPISSGGGLQSRKGWCFAIREANVLFREAVCKAWEAHSSTGFQPSPFELRLGEPFFRA